MAAAGLLSGCATGTMTTELSRPPQWLAYASSLDELEVFELESDYATMLRRHSEEPSHDTALRLSLLLANPGTNFYDAARAASLAGEAARLAGPDDAAGDYAEILASLLGRLAEHESDVATLQRRRAELESQIEALIELEDRVNAGALDQAP